MKTLSFIRKGFIVMMAVCFSAGMQSCLKDDDNT